MESISVFEIIKVGIGPSSSHTMGPWKAAEMFLQEIKTFKSIAEVEAVYVEFFGSLSKTGIGHGTDIASMLGLSGENYKEIDTNTINDKIEKIKDTQILNLGNEKEIPFIYGTHLILNKEKSLDFHPNGMIYKAVFKDETSFEKDYYSVGGGFVATQEENSIQDFCVRTTYPCHKGEDILKYCTQLNLSKVSDLVYLNEESWRSKEDTRKEALYIWEQIKECIFTGISKEGVLPGGLKVSRRAAGFNKHLLGDVSYSNVEEWMSAIQTKNHSFSEINRWISCFALAVNEENASFGRIITAPTNGASGVIPAVLMYSQLFTAFKSEEDIVRFILVAG